MPCRALQVDGFHQVPARFPGFRVQWFVWRLTFLQLGGVKRKVPSVACRTGQIRNPSR